MYHALSGLASKLGLVFSVLLFLSPAGESGTLRREYRMTVNVGPSFYWGMGAAKFAELVREKTDGRIVIKPYYGSALLKGAQLKSPQMVAKGAIGKYLDSTNTQPVVAKAGTQTKTYGML